MRLLFRDGSITGEQEAFRVLVDVLAEREVELTLHQVTLFVKPDCTPSDECGTVAESGNQPG